jgi:hypothetical protein
VRTVYKKDFPNNIELFSHECKRLISVFVLPTGEVPNLYTSTPTTNMNDNVENKGYIVEVDPSL